MSAPDGALTVIFWLHMLATVVWLGGLAAITGLVVPLGQRLLPPERLAPFLEGVQRRFDPLAWLSLVVLLATGMFQMSSNPNYEGMLAITNRWAVAMLLKHLVFAGMAGVNAAITFGVLPGLRRAALRRQKGLDAPELEALQGQEARLLQFNLLLGVAVLALTALARVS